MFEAIRLYFILRNVYLLKLENRLDTTFYSDIKRIIIYSINLNVIIRSYNSSKNSDSRKFYQHWANLHKIEQNTPLESFKTFKHCYIKI